MKRFCALILAALLLAGAAGVSALAENAPASSAAASETVEREDAEPGTQTEDPAPVPDESGDPAEAELSAISVYSSAAVTASNPAASLRFSELRATMEKYSDTVRSLRAAYADLKDADTDAIDGAVAGLRMIQQGVAASLTNARTGMANNSAQTEEGGYSDLYYIYSDLVSALTATGGLLDAQITSLQSQADSLSTTVETTQNTLMNSINQVVKGAESLYLGIQSMELAQKGVERSIAALDRAVAIREKQLALGMASAYDVETIRYQRSQAVSGLETLKFQIRTSKITLENLCGMETRGTVSLETPALPTAEELAAVSYENNLKTAMERNVDVQNAEEKRYQGETDHDANKKALDAAKSSFAASYKVLCLTVPEKNRLVQAAQETADYQQRTADIAQEKYNRGMISHEELRSAQDTLSGAQDDLETARLNLLTAYRSYIWATDCGIA